MAHERRATMKVAEIGSAFGSLIMASFFFAPPRSATRHYIVVAHRILLIIKLSNLAIFVRYRTSLGGFDPGPG